MRPDLKTEIDGSFSESGFKGLGAVATAFSNVSFIFLKIGSKKDN